MKVCNRAGCVTLFNGKSGRCPEHELEARRARPDNKVYASREHRAFRTAVLTRDQVCVITGCDEPATVADHHPLKRRELAARGMDPNDPRHGRGLCARHHNQHTARTAPGGFRQTRDT